MQIERYMRGEKMIVKGVVKYRGLVNDADCHKGTENGIGRNGRVRLLLDTFSMVLSQGDIRVCFRYSRRETILKDHGNKSVGVLSHFGAFMTKRKFPFIAVKRTKHA